MVTGIFANIPFATAELHIELWDYDESGYATWRVRNGDDTRYIEGHLDDEVWTIVGRAASAYEDEV